MNYKKITILIGPITNQTANFANVKHLIKYPECTIKLKWND